MAIPTFLKNSGKLRGLANDRSIVTKKADKCSFAVIWDRNDYIAEAEKQLSDGNIYKDSSFRDNSK